MSKLIAIKGVGSLSALGWECSSVWERYLDNKSYISSDVFDEENYPVAKLPKELNSLISNFLKNNSYYKRHDKSAILAILASAEAFKDAKWTNNKDTGINIGSSRGTTDSFEKYHKNYLEHPNHETPVITSPLTTLGNISSSVAGYLSLDGPFIDHSVTCSTSSYSIANAIAWIKSGMVSRFLAGGSETPLTPFTIAQMKALNIYSPNINDDYPCRPLDCSDNKLNTMVLGEGSCVFAIEGIDREKIEIEKPHVIIESIAYAYEKPPSATGISSEGKNLQKSMTDALNNMVTPEPVDLVIMHAPGTRKGDSSELYAIEKVFGENMPNLTCNKWKIGHTFAAAATFSMQLGIMCIKNNKCIDIPYSSLVSNTKRDIKKVMINSAGFGGNVSSVIISSPGLF